MRSKICIVASALATAGGMGWRVATADDWLQFRGNDQRSVAQGAAPPLAWSADDPQAKNNVAWRTPLPGRGVSSPIVVGDRVFVTSSSGPGERQLHVVCLSAADGRLLWQRNFLATGRTLCHPTSAVAANTPASDGRHVVAMFSSNDVVCLDLEGNLLWLRGLTFDFPDAANDVGLASSPLIMGDRVIVQIDSKSMSLAAALDLRNGRTLWQLERDREMNWTSPAATSDAVGNDVLLLQSAVRVTAHDPATGGQLWNYPVSGASGIPSLVGVGQVVYLPVDGLTALRWKSGDPEVEVAWKAAQLTCGNASPVVHEDRVYVLNRTGVITCGDTATGEVKWRQRLKGTFWATPVLVAGRLYAFNSEGLGQVIDASNGEVLAESPLGEETMGSPAVADGALFVRTAAHLVKIAQR